MKSAEKLKSGKPESKVATSKGFLRDNIKRALGRSGIVLSRGWRKTMMAPFDTRLLGHRADHLRPATEAERTAALLARANRQRFRDLVARLSRYVPRYAQVRAQTLAHR